MRLEEVLPMLRAGQVIFCTDDEFNVHLVDGKIVVRVPGDEEIDDIPAHAILCETWAASPEVATGSM